MMDRSIGKIQLFAVSFFILVILAAFLLLNQTPKAEPYTVGIVIANEERYEKVEGLKEGMQELGYVEEEHVRYITFNLNEKREFDEQMLVRINQAHPDVLVTTGALETELARRTTKDIPIIFIGVASPESIGLKPTSTITGIDNGQLKLIGKRIELITHWIPQANRVLGIADVHAPMTNEAIKEAEGTAKKLGVDIDILKITSRKELEIALNDLENREYDAILPLPSFLIEEVITDLIPLLTEKKLFVMGAYPEQVGRGLFASYGISFLDQGKQAARLVAKRLNGYNKPIPIEIPDSVYISINKVTMEQLEIPLSDQQLSLVHQYYGEDH